MFIQENEIVILIITLMITLYFFTGIIIFFIYWNYKKNKEKSLELKDIVFFVLFAISLIIFHNLLVSYFDTKALKTKCDIFYQEKIPLAETLNYEIPKDIKNLEEQIFNRDYFKDKENIKNIIREELKKEEEKYKNICIEVYDR